ncbi:zinc finger, CCHC-type containing protein [Tanacetum coccineum]
MNDGRNLSKFIIVQTVSCIIDQLPPSWKYFKHTLKHQKKELTLIELGSNICIEETLRVQDNDKPKGNNVAGPSIVNMMEHNSSFRYNDNKGKRKNHDTKADLNKKSKVTCWKCRKPGHLKKDCKGGKVGNKANALGKNGSVDGSTNSPKACMSLGHVHFKRMQDMSKERAVVRLPDPHMKTLGKRGIECIFVRYAKHSKAFRFSSVPRQSLSIPNGTKDIGGLVIPEEDNPNTFDEAMKSRDVAFWKEAINDEMDSIIANNTWVLADLPPLARISTVRLLIAMISIHSLSIHQMDVKTTFLNGELEDEFSIKDMGEADVILVMDTLSDVSEYLNKLEAYLDDGDSPETRMDKIENSEEELDIFEALERKSVVVESLKKMWEAIERLHKVNTIIQDVKTNLFWEFSQSPLYDGETMGVLTTQILQNDE